MGPTEINGLPAHVLLVHVVVIMVPITALLLLLSAFWPAARARIGVVLPIVALVTLISVPLTTDAGEFLEGKLGHTELIEKHADLGDQLLPWAIGLFVLAVAVWAAHRFVRAGQPPTVLTVVLAVLAVVVAVGSVVMIYRIGDSGAQAAWKGTLNG